jgi:hypothetical protein
MELQEILQQPDGFTPPAVTVKIEKVFPFKSGDGDNGPWSFQAVKVSGGGELKLKNLDPFPEDRIGETVTLRAFSSPKHGLTGMKVAHEQYQGKTYDKLHITKTCLWEWAENNGAHTNGNGQPGTNAAPKTQSAPTPRSQSQFDLKSHLLACAEIAETIAATLGLADDSARQACFATVCIDAQRHNVILGAPDPVTEPTDGRRDALLKGVRSACKLLNDEGYEPPFTAASLDRYVNDEFKVSGGLANLSTDNVETLIKKLSDLLDTFRADKEIEEPTPEPGGDEDIPF